MDNRHMVANKEKTVDKGKTYRLSKKVEEEMVKEIYTLAKEVEDIIAYKPSKEEAAKGIELMIEKLKEEKMTLSPPLTEYTL